MENLTVIHPAAVCVLTKIKKNKQVAYGNTFSSVTYHTFASAKQTGKKISAPHRILKQRFALFSVLSLISNFI